MSAQTRRNLLAWLRQSYRQACRCQAIAWTRGLDDQASRWGQLQIQLADEIATLEWEG